MKGELYQPLKASAGVWEGQGKGREGGGVLGWVEAGPKGRRVGSGKQHSDQAVLPPRYLGVE